MITVVHDDCRRALPRLEVGRFRCCVTSPPYWEQREYLPTGHPEKHLEVGHEATPAAYVAALVDIFREVRRVLADDGTLWINVGDKYAVEAPGGRSPGGDHFGKSNRLVDRGSIPARLGKGRTPGVPGKGLIGIPWRLALALQDDGWILRSEIVWWKPNAMPSSVEDRPTVAHEHVFMLAKSPRYYFDQEAVREPHQGPLQRRRTVRKPSQRPGQPPQTWSTSELREVPGHDGNPAGRNVRSVWEIPTEASDGAHVAPMPRALARRCILAGSAIRDHVLDPFGGTGTVAAVADEEGRHATTIDLDATAARLPAQAGLLAGGR